jgi:bla regulator protein BlaR1
VKLVTPPLVLLPISVPQHWVPSAQQADTVSEEMMFATEGSAVARNPTDTQGARSAASTSQYSLRSATNEWWNPVHVAMGVWLGGMLWMLGRGFIRFYRFHRMLQREGCVDNAAAEFVAQLVSSRAGNGRHRFSPRVLRVPVRVSPMLFGFGHRPVIVCPDQLWTSLNAAEQQSFLAHETAHFCRRDHWVRWIEWFVTAIYWWFPGVYVARRHLERNEEACCDAWAVQQLKSPPRE